MARCFKTEPPTLHFVRVLTHIEILLFTRGDVRLSVEPRRWKPPLGGVRLFPGKNTCLPLNASFKMESTQI
jgi:hypothetical protein